MSMLLVTYLAVPLLAHLRIFILRYTNVLIIIIIIIIVIVIISVTKRLYGYTYFFGVQPLYKNGNCVV